MPSENYEGLSVGDRLGCGVAGLAAIPWFMLLGLGEAIASDDGSDTNGFFLNVFLPTVALAALVYFTVSRLLNALRAKQHPPKAQAGLWWAASVVVVLLAGLVLFPIAILISL